MKHLINDITVEMNVRGFVALEIYTMIVNSKCFGGFNRGSEWKMVQEIYPAGVMRKDFFLWSLHLWRAGLVECQRFGL